MNIRRMPDLVVFKDDRAHFIEVKYRASGNLTLNDIAKYGDYPFENALFVLVTKKHIKCISYKELSEGTYNEEITEVIDVSPVYLFFDEVTDSVEFNRRNMISSTNWLVNIDKRLTLKQVLPHLQYLQEKRQEG